MWSSRTVLLLLCLAALPDPARGEDGAAARLTEADGAARTHEALLQAFRDRPEDPELNVRLGRAAQEKGDFEAAVMAFERVIIQDPGNLPARIELARSFLRLGAGETARLHCEAILKDKPPPEVRRTIETLLREIP